MATKDLSIINILVAYLNVTVYENKTNFLEPQMLSFETFPPKLEQVCNCFVKPKY